MSDSPLPCQCMKHFPKGADRDETFEVRYVGHQLASDCVVDCDEDCRALLSPVTVDELRAALVHWHRHRFCSGCSHGC